MTSGLQDIIIELLNFALAEDIGDGDVTGNSTIPQSAIGTFVFKTREEIVLCGMEVIGAAFPKAKLYYEDGEKLPANSIIAEVTGNVRDILMKERSVLNIIQHLSGIATETAKYVEAVKDTDAQILDTRKTLPLLRELQKYAVRCGGGTNHRMGLYDMVMIKDNHIKAAGGINAAVHAARKTGQEILVECDSLEQVQQAIEAGCDIIMADNMTNDELREVVKIVGGRMKVEASGNVNLQTIRAIAETGVDRISIGRLTHSVRAVDIGLDCCES